MTRFSPLLLVAVSAACASAPQVAVTAATPVGPTPATAMPTPAVGDVAPDFMFVPITSAGIAAMPKKLSDYRGQTVVLWLFIKARTRG